MAEVDGCVLKKKNSDADIVCTPCSEDNIREQAIKYCPECQEFLCAGCTRHHGRLKISRSHTLVDKGEANNTPHVTMATAKCLFHPDREIEMYCREHDMVYCLKCALSDHKSCTGVTGFEDFTSFSNQTQEFDRLQTDIDNVKERLENTDRKTQTNIRSIEEEKDDAISQIEEMAQDLVDHIRKLKNEALETLESEYTLVKEELESNISLVDQVKQKIEEVSSQLNRSDSLDSKQQFIQSKLVQKAVNDAAKVLEQYQGKGCQSLRFKEDTGLKSSVITSTSLGCIQKESEDNSMPKMIPRIYKVKSKREVNVRLGNDCSHCYNIDICQLPDGTIIMAEYNNKRIKRLDVNYNIKDYLDVGDYPRGICCTGNTEVAVKLYSKVQFISVGSSLSKLRDISVLHGGYNGMTYYAGELWVSAYQSVNVYNTSGTLLKTISNDVNGKCMFKSSIQQMVVSGDTVIVADYSDGVVCLMRDSTVKRELRDRSLKNTMGVCASEDGTVFIAGYISNNIVMFDSDGKCLGVLVDKDSGLVKPTSLMYDEKRNCLVVGCYPDSIKVYDI